jgi:hypothetical protein
MVGAIGSLVVRAPHANGIRIPTVNDKPDTTLLLPLLWQPSRRYDKKWNTAVNYALSSVTLRTNSSRCPVVQRQRSIDKDRLPNIHHQTSPNIDHQTSIAKHRSPRRNGGTHSKPVAARYAVLSPNALRQNRTVQ